MLKIDWLTHCCSADTSHTAQFVTVARWLFVRAVFQDLQKARIANFVCKEHVVAAQCTCNFFVNFWYFSQKHANFNSCIVTDSHLLRAYNPAALCVWSFLISTRLVETPSWWPVNSASENVRPSTRPMLTGNGNRSPVNSGRQLG